MSIPYMGSKRKSASKIANIIEAFTKGNKKEKEVVDLFCGGFAIGEEFLKRGYKVIANDKNKYVIALLKKVINGELDEKECLKWISREKFFDIIKNPNKYEDWYVGYTQCIWSFGNNQKGYLFSPENENLKKSFYDLVAYKKIDETVKDIIKQEKYINYIIKQNNFTKRILSLKKITTILFKRLIKGKGEDFKKYKKIVEKKFTSEMALTFTKWLKNTGITAKEVNKLTNTQMASHYLSSGVQPAIPKEELFEKIKLSNKIPKRIPKEIKNLVYEKDLVRRELQKEFIGENFSSLERLKQLEKLNQLENLKRFGNLKKIEKQNLQITNKSYDEVEIPKNAIVYCDPPYQGTAKYSEGGFNHKEFWDYIREISKTNKVFVSEYIAPKDFKVIYKFSQKSTLCIGNQSHNKQPQEKIFIYNG